MLIRSILRCLLLAAALAVAAPSPVRAAAWPAPREGTYVVPEFRFADGESLRDLRLHYVTLGQPHRDGRGRVDNAVLVLHGTGGDTNQFLSDRFAGVLFAPGGLLDAARYFIVITDGIGHGTSSKPSDGLRARFPHYGYRDMVAAQHLVLTQALHVDHLRLVMGTSMGGMQTWLWGETYPTMMDALLPLASLPVQIAGRNRVWRDMIVDDLRGDPDYRGGNYTAEPAHGLKAAWDVEWIFGSAPLYDQSLMPTQAASDAYYAEHVKPTAQRLDANDMIYQFESSRDYDPRPNLGAIVAPLLAINSADDQINPPELGIMEREIANVRHGRFVLLPITAETRGHGTHTLPAIWQGELRGLMGTEVDVQPHRLAGGRAMLEPGTSLELPAQWTFDVRPAFIHEAVYTLMPPQGVERLEIVLSAAIYNDKPSFASSGMPYCINGLHGRIEEERDGRFISLAVGEHRDGAHYISIWFRKGDAASERIARTLRVAGVSGHC